MSDTTERARRALTEETIGGIERFHSGGTMPGGRFVRERDYDALAVELAAAEKRNAELERRLAVLDSPHLFDAIRAITNLSQNDVELAIRAVRIAMDMAQAGHDAGVAALAAASEGKP